MAYRNINGVKYSAWDVIPPWQFAATALWFQRSQVLEKGLAASISQAILQALDEYALELWAVGPVIHEKEYGFKL